MWALRCLPARFHPDLAPNHLLPETFRCPVCTRPLFKGEKKKKECRHLAEVGIFLATLKWFMTVPWVRTRADSLGCRSATRSENKAKADSCQPSRQILLLAKLRCLPVSAPSHQHLFPPCFKSDLVGGPEETPCRLLLHRPTEPICSAARAKFGCGAHELVRRAQRPSSRHQLSTLSGAAVKAQRQGPELLTQWAD